MRDVDEVAKEYIDKINQWVKEGRNVIFRNKHVAQVEFVRMVRKNTVHVKVHITYTDGTEEVISVSEFMKKQLRVV